MDSVRLVGVPDIGGSTRVGIIDCQYIVNTPNKHEQIYNETRVVEVVGQKLDLPHAVLM